MASSYLDYPRVFDIAAQLYADQLSEDQRFHLQNELDDEAVMNILGEHSILTPQSIFPLILSTTGLLGQYPDAAKKPQGQARRNYNIQEAAGIDPAVYKVMKVHSPAL
jgi:hypothetical protein